MQSITNEFNQIVGSLVENWQPAIQPPKTLMQGRYCLLEPLEISKHAEKLYTALQFENQGELWTYLPYGPFKTYEEFHEWLSMNIISENVFYAIVDINTHMPIGISSYLRINMEHGVIEVGHLQFSKLLQRTAAATEAMFLMMQHVFAELGYRRYEWKCNSLNQASCNAARRLGFKFEGIFRQSNVYKNRNRDTAWFSIIDEEWPEIRNRLLKWLNPQNFDEKGEQIFRLQEL